MAFNIADLFEHAVDAVGDRTALICGGSRLTYAELDQSANRMGHYFAGRGIGAGDHVGIHAQNSAEWVVAMLAAFKVRAVPININYRYVADELAYLFDDADLVALVHDATYAPRIAAVRGSFNELSTLVAIGDGSGEDTTELGSVPWEEALAAGSPTRDFAERSPDDHYILYTGGTTGMPKGVVWRSEDVFYALGGGVNALTNERVTDEWALANAAAEADEPLVTLCSPPLMHGAAQWGTLRFLFGGNTVVLVPRFEAELVWDTVAIEACSALTITGDAMGRPLVEALEANPDRWDLSGFAALTSTAAVFSPTVKDRFLELMPNLMIIDAIGSTEGGHNGLATTTRDSAARTQGVTVSAGRDAVVLDDELAPVAPGSGAVGRVARSGNIPIGYHKDPDKTAASFPVDAHGTRWAIPGDFATVEADGSITLLGRGSVCINSGGEKIFPEEVESVLKAHPKVFDAVVIGVPDNRWGETVAAVVQARSETEPPSLDELDAHTRSSIASYKVPRVLHIVDEVVRSPSGKPDYPWAKRLTTGA